MNRLLLHILVFAFCTTGLLNKQNAVGQNQVYRPRADKPHVAFELPTIEGKEMVELADFRGKKVLLFHFASW